MENPYTEGSTMHLIADALFKARRPLSIVELEAATGGSYAMVSIALSGVGKATSLYRYRDPAGSQRLLYAVKKFKGYGDPVEKRAHPPAGQGKRARTKKAPPVALNGTSFQPSIGEQVRVVAMVFDEHNETVNALCRAMEHGRFTGTPSSRARPRLGEWAQVISLGLTDGGLQVTLAGPSSMLILDNVTGATDGEEH